MANRPTLRITSKLGHNYVTIFIDMERRSELVLFITPGKSKETPKPSNPSWREGHQAGQSKDSKGPVICPGLSHKA